MFLLNVVLAHRIDAQKIDEVYVSIALENAKLINVFHEIEDQSEFHFTIHQDEGYLNKRISADHPRISVEDLLKEIGRQTGLSFQQVNSNIAVRQAKKENSRSVAAPIQSRNVIDVNGTVNDENGTPMPGVSVLEQGTSNGTVTDIDGQYSLQVNTGAVLVFSFLGYEKQTFEVGNQAEINVQMTPDLQGLDEVVVVGYGTQRKIQTLGSQSAVNVKELKQPVANISTVLAGRVSGLVGVQRSAEPGLDGADLWIRGVNTLSQNNSKPLILVDGVQRDFNNLDPNDIESFTILKDASSTSVYGVRGANGVVLITTKKGEAGKTKINLDYYRGITEFTKVPEPADGVTYMQMANEASVTRGGQPVYSADMIHKTYTQEDPYLYPNVNWMDHIFNQFGQNEKANLNISGGGEKMTYYVSAGYYSETGLFTTDDLAKYNAEISFNRYNFTSHLSIKPTKTTTIDLGIKGWISNGNYPGTGTNTIFSEVFETYPTLYPLKYPNGVEPWVSTGGGLNNPYYLLTNRGYSTLYNNQINSDIHVKQDLGFVTKGLSARVLYAFDASNSNRLVRNKVPYTVYATGRDENGELIYEQTDNGNGRDYLTFSRSNGGDRQFYLEAALNYDNDFGNHHVGGLLLFNSTDRISATAGDLIGSIPYRGLGAVGRFNYGYDDRYIAELSFGYNGAENFAPDERFGFFPSGAVGWVLSNEDFFGDADKVFQYFRLRASYGIVGNSNIDGRRFAYIPTVANTGGYSYGQDRGNYIGGLDIGEYAANVTWETETDVNLGIEFTTLNDALNMEVDFFNRRRENIFLERAAVPGSMGLRSNLLGNLGITNSKGVDVSADYNMNFGQLNMQLRGTFTYNENEVIENDQPTPPYDYMERRGHSIGQRFGYVAQGYYTQEEIDDESVAKTAGVVQAGDIKFKDLNMDGVVDANDRTAIGKGDIPKIVYGFGTTLSYKGFSMGAFFQGVGIVDLYLSNQFMPFREGSARGGLYKNIKDRWTPENPSQEAFYPRLSYGSDINQNYSATSSHWLMNGRFLRLKTLDFGWNIPKGSLGSLGVSDMRIYFIGYNLLTFSPFDMYDPELGNGSGTRYPNIRTYSLGVNVSF
ncbi:TonB-dependent receptor [Echinicola soli]|uniref:TonB-dependent receptor n=2 Tax=Echinicola soli TaxID=2591634 RepID=A0A514CPB6_9BACT|nr:TonB-dependent receptor [Echinicola soli]